MSLKIIVLIYTCMSSVTYGQSLGGRDEENVLFKRPALRERLRTSEVKQRHLTSDVTIFALTSDE